MFDAKKEIEELITILVREGGSDLHLGAGRVPAIRVTGQLIFLVKRNVLSQENMDAILKEVVEKKRYDEFMEKQELDFSYNFKDEARLRGNTFFQKGLLSQQIIPS